MIKSKLKRLLDYCPRPEKPLTTTLKRYSLPITIVMSVATIAIVSFYLLSLSTLTQPTSPTSIPAPPLPPEVPTLESDYYPGVSVEDYVIYGNFACNEVHQGEGWVCVNDLAFKKVEVIEVSEKEVTLRHTQQYKNGSATRINGCTETWNVEEFFWSNETDPEDWIDYGLIIAANLTEGCLIHSHNCSFPEHILTKTEARTYLDVSRNVNIIISNQDIAVYDLETGFLLESEHSTSDGDVISAMSIVETNIFSSPTPSPESFVLQETTAQSIPTEVLYVILGLVVVVVAAAIVVILRKRKLQGGENDKE